MDCSLERRNIRNSRAARARAKRTARTEIPATSPVGLAALGSGVDELESVVAVFVTLVSSVVDVELEAAEVSEDPSVVVLLLNPMLVLEAVFVLEAVLVLRLLFVLAAALTPGRVLEPTIAAGVTCVVAKLLVADGDSVAIVLS